VLATLLLHIAQKGQHHTLESYKRTSEIRINLTIFKSYKYKTNEKLTLNWFILLCVACIASIYEFALKGECLSVGLDSLDFFE